MKLDLLLYSYNLRADIITFADQAEIMWSFCLSFIVSFCKQDN